MNEKQVREWLRERVDGIQEVVTRSVTNEVVTYYEGAAEMLLDLTHRLGDEVLMDEVGSLYDCLSGRSRMKLVGERALAAVTGAATPLLSDFNLVAGVTRISAGMERVAVSDRHAVFAERSVLRPCPFCGGRAEARREVGGIYFVVCSVCLTKSATGSSEAAVVARWNHRIADFQIDQLMARVADLEAGRGFWEL